MTESGRVKHEGVETAGLYPVSSGEGDALGEVVTARIGNLIPGTPEL